MTRYENYGPRGGSESIPNLTATHDVINGQLVPKSQVIRAHQQPIDYEPRVEVPQPERRSRRGLGKVAVTLVLAGGMAYGCSELGAEAAHWTHDNLPWVSDAIGFFQQIAGSK